MSKLPFLQSAIEFNINKNTMNQDLADFRVSVGQDQSVGILQKTSNSFFEKGIVLRETDSFQMPEYEDNEKMIDEARMASGLKTQH